jgi:hypothetical protein
VVEKRSRDEGQQPIFFLFSLGSFRNWLKLVRFNSRFGRIHWLPASFTAFHRFLSIPLRVYNRLRYGPVIKQTTIDQPPVFIIGHWRSGTTYLHNLLCQDENLSYITMSQVAAPEIFPLDWEVLQRIAAQFIPPTRPMDNIALSVDSPQEEEFAVANMSPCSFYHQWSFPRNARHYFDRYVLFHNTPSECIDRWKDVYMDVLRRIAYGGGGKRVVTKNPTNMGRIAILLELFPDAKFIHIYRNPYIVFLSTQHLYNRFLPMFQLQTVTQEEIEANIFFFYEQLVKKFLSDRSLIPADNLVEVRFEDLETNPLAELRRIYDSLSLPGFETAQPAFRTYISSQADYRKNPYALSKEVIEKVNQHWRFAIDAWGYDPLVGTER